MFTAVHSRQTGPVDSRQRRLLVFELFYPLIITNEPKLREYTHRQIVPVYPQQRSGNAPRHAAGDIVRPTPLQMTGRRSRTISAVDVVRQ